MAQTEKEVDTATADDKGKEGKNSKVAEYLQAPRKKRKSYVLMALGNQAQQDLESGIEHFVRSNFKAVAMAMPRTPEELFKNFSRQIVLLVFDDEFTDLNKGLEMLAELKRRKNSSPVPVLFLTRHPQALIEAYNKILSAYHEADDYVNYSKTELNHIYSKIKFGLNNKNRRRSRRYKIDIDLEYFVLNDNKMHKGKLLDLSVHGALVKSADGSIYRPGEQLKLHLPTSEYLSLEEGGDFLKLSARVRRVFISGDQAGISFEHVSERQSFLLTSYLTSLVNDQNVKRNMAAKAKAARA